MTARDGEERQVQSCSLIYLAIQRRIELNPTLLGAADNHSPGPSGGSGLLSHPAGKGTLGAH